jgi:hypothetical protein
MSEARFGASISEDLFMAQIPTPVRGGERGVRRFRSRLLFDCLPLGLALGLAAGACGSAGATKYAGEFLKLGIGARALGMGSGFVALANDASAAYWNPAGLATLPKAEMLFMHAEQFGSLANHDYIGFAQPLSGTGRRSSVGIGLIRFSVDNILVTKDAYVDLNHNGQWDPRHQDESGHIVDAEPILPDRFRTESDTEYGLLLSYAREVSDRFALGGNAKLIRQGLLDNTSFGMGLDLGILYHGGYGLDFGARLADATTTLISWDTGHRESVMPSLSLGASWTRPLEAVHGNLTAVASVNSSFDGRKEASQFSGGPWGGDFQGGLEYWYGRSVAARVGSDAGHFTAGAGLRFRGLGADYAYLSHEELDATHRISASVRF